MKTCYGYEIVDSDGRDNVCIYKTLEAARSAALKRAEAMRDDETMILFSAPADDMGKLASNQFGIIDAWGK